MCDGEGQKSRGLFRPTLYLAPAHVGNHDGHLLGHNVYLTWGGVAKGHGRGGGVIKKNIYVLENYFRSLLEG